MEESAEPSPRAFLAEEEIAADNRAKIVRVVKLLLRPVGVGATQPERTTLCVVSPRFHDVPVWARRWAIADANLSTRILVVVSIHAGLPIVLDADRAPQGFELVGEKLLGHRTGK